MKRTIYSLSLAFIAIVWLVFSGLKEASLFFYFPIEVNTEIKTGEIEPQARIRIGGFVSPGSIETSEEGVLFTLTDDENGLVEVWYTGILPDMFAEGQGAVVEGVFDNDIDWVFFADAIFVKHGEEYSKEHLDKSEMKEKFGSGIPSGTIE